jgi:uncharacterized membrane protein
MLNVTPKKDPVDIAEQAAPAEPQAVTPAESQAGTPTEPQAAPPAEPQKSEQQDKAQKGDSSASKKESANKRKRKRHPVKSLLRILIALIIIAGGIYLILFAVAYFAKYDSIAAMLESMRVELDLMWQRIRN